MSSFEDFAVVPASFTGKVRLFPLPNLVLFPHVMQPLRIFEPRYRAMLEDALAGDRLITMALLAPGWEQDYEGRPPIHSMACLSQITTHHQLDDGTYNLLVLGIRRVRLIEEQQPLRPFREATVEIFEDYSPPQEAAVRADLQRSLREAFLGVLPTLPDAHEQLDQLLGSDISLAVFTDTIAYMLDMKLAEKAELLGERNVVRRAQILLRHLQAVGEDVDLAPCQSCGFPPKFSTN